MRTIKFRGKSIHDGRWLFGDLLRADIDGGWEIQYYDEEDGWMSERVDENTVGEFAGLTDCEEQEIFEDDIVALYFDRHCTFKGVVRFMAGQFLAYKNDGLFTPLSRKPWLVIGNIHDNPELMEGGDQ